MATIVGYTAERMKQISDETVVGAEIVNGNLILNRKGMPPINAGSIIGPEGPMGPPGSDGDVSEAMMNAAIASALDAFKETIPQGVIALETRTSQINGIPSGTVQDVLSSTFTYKPGRALKITGYVPMSTPDTASRVKVMSIRDTNNVNITSDYITSTSTTYAHNSVRVVQSTGDPATYKLSVWSGASQCNVFTSSQRPATLLIEDIGPWI